MDTDKLVHHAIALQRYGNGVVARMLAVLQKADAELFATLTEALERSPEGYSAQRLEAMLRSLREINAAAYDRMGDVLRAELAEFVASEAAFHQQFLLASVPANTGVAAVQPDQVYSAAYAQPLRISKGGAVPMASFLSGLSADRIRVIRDAVALGWLEGEATASIVRRLRGTRANGFEDGLMQAPRRHVEGLVRTAVNHMANFTQQRVFQANSDLVTHWQFVATLDSRTSITCASLDGKRFKLGEGPIPPRHINCRSVAAPVLKTWRELGVDADEHEPGTRASSGGQVAAKSFSAWLRDQPRSVQDDVLGPTRGALFRSNKITVDAFTNNKGIVYSLADLKKRNADLFKSVN